MRIVIRPMPQPQPADGTCVGTLDGVPLVLTEDRAWLADGRVYYQADLGEALVDAVDRAASAVLGSEWVTTLARLVQVNRRTTSKDRIAKFGLPEYVLLFLAHAADHEHPRALGYALLCVEAAQSAHGVTLDTAATGRPTRIDIVGRNFIVDTAMKRATEMVDNILAERDRFRKMKSLTDE